MSQSPLLAVENLRKTFPVRRQGWGGANGLTVRAVDGVSFTVNEGETLGLVGESGCGKSTVGKTVIRLIDPSGGRIVLDGLEITNLSQAELQPVRRDIQMIFQDPFSSLNPRMTAGDAVAEPLRVHGLAHGAETQERVAKLFARVGLSPDQMSSYPNEFSGGQRQRIGIARALAVNPRIIIGDEPVSALDVSIQAQVINLLVDLREQLNIAYLFIAHDLAVVEHISHRIAVMYLGRIVELAPTADIFANPLHPYTQALLDAVPPTHPRQRKGRTGLISGEVPSPITPPPGCHFHARCPLAKPRCTEQAPVLTSMDGDHQVACHLY